MTDPMTPDAFVDRWSQSGAAERANYQLFLAELCDVLELPRPEPTQSDEAANAYVFERDVRFVDPDGSTSVGRIDLYKRGSFVLEAKQGADASTAASALAETTRDAARRRKKGTATRGTAGWDRAMIAARNQAEAYARALPPSEPRPPFLVVVDVGHAIDLYAEFTQTGGVYVAFPDVRSNRTRLADVLDADHRERLRQVWTDPLALDPSRRSARVTTELAGRLAALARSLETAGHGADAVGTFLMRCLFTFFAEDAGLLPANGVSQLIAGLPGLDHFAPQMSALWQAMKSGGYAPALSTQVKHFNGHLFEDAQALEVTEDQLALLVEAGKANWRNVEPAIFGTLLERALDPVERHKLGAHYTPRAYVERLVQPTIIAPLTERWQSVQTAAVKLDEDGKPREARDALMTFHRDLCTLRVLDPACGSGNFLYVTLEHLMRLEGEVLKALAELSRGGHQAAFLGADLEVERLEVRPEQMLGLEVNPRAVVIAELVLWIGWLQWHQRTIGAAEINEPILGRSRTISCIDAVLLWDNTEPMLDAAGQPRTRWDGRTFTSHQATGELVPDEAARVPLVRYLNPRPTTWPKADYVVGNPPFLGAGRMRDALGDGYAEALRGTYPAVPESADFVMYWWHKAAELARAGELHRFGLITTNSVRQTFNRRVLQQHMDAKPPLGLRFAIPDHPWVDSADGANVRIAMTVADVGAGSGVLRTVRRESPGEHGEVVVELAEQRGRIHADLTVGAAVTDAVGLRANDGLSCPGVKLHGAGFIVSPAEARGLGLGSLPGLERHIRPYVNGRDLTRTSRGAMVIDLFGLTALEVRELYPAVFQHVVERVKPERDAKSQSKDGAGYARLWWLFGKPRESLRRSLAALPRYIATAETSKHRFFVFLDAAILPDNMLVNIALDEAYFLAVLSSRAHVTWALAVGGRLGAGNDPRYNKTRCFDTFPFPTSIDAQRHRLRELGEQLDAHRKRQQAAHPGLSMTDMYNALEALRAGNALTPKERATHEKGLVTVLREIHDAIDAAVADAYGWPADMPDAEILERLVALNAERAAEEARGKVRWLRPNFKAPGEQLEAQGAFDGLDADGVASRDGAANEAIPWPLTLPEQVQATLRALVAIGHPATVTEVADQLAGRSKLRKDAVGEILATLAMLGRAHAVAKNRYVAR